MASSIGLAELANPDDPNADIVFVHGLGGDRIQTWKHENQTFWPTDLLPHDCPTARILSFGYKPHLDDFYPVHSSGQGSGATTIDSHSKELLEALAHHRSRTETEDRPTIFVAHGFGGLVCANALSGHYDTDPTYKHILDNMVGLLFLGTPFERSKKDFVQLALRYHPELKTDDLKNLEEQSQKLFGIKEAFVRFVRTRDNSSSPLEIACFFEEEKTTIQGSKIMIVPEKSATLSGFDSYSIPADHYEICKFKGNYDVGYRYISRLLRQWIRSYDVVKGAADNVVFTSQNYANLVTGNIYNGNIDSTYFGSKS